MVVEFLKAKGKDFDDLVDFANYVFSHAGGKTDFPSLLPKLYKKENNTMENHYIVKEDGKIKAVVGAFPMELYILGNTLKVCGIGTVSVHPYSRGSGYMKKLMNMALEDMKKEGVHISCLGGKRQRYEYFGYTPCGQKAHYTINAENIKHKRSDCINKDIIFKKVDDSNLEFIDKAYELYNKNKIRFIREKESFFHILKSWDFDVYSIYDKDNFIGYIVVDKDKRYISELVVEKQEDFIKILANYINSNEIEEINIELPFWEKKNIKSLNKFVEEVTINNCYQFNILNYEETINHLLNFKVTYSNLIDGAMSFDILEYGKFQIVVKDKKAIINRFDGQCDIKLNNIEAMQLFFSPLGNYLVDNEKYEEMINSWFPIPLFIPTQDKV